MKETTINFDYEIEKENGDCLNLKVSATYYPPSLGCRDSFGAPMEPDEDGEILLTFFDMACALIGHSVIQDNYPDDYEAIVERGWEQLETEIID
jgi:hypothetical protein